MVYRDYLNADPTYTSARSTNQSDHGWDFTPTTRRRPSLYGSALKGLAVLLIGLSAVWALALAVMP